MPWLLCLVGLALLAWRIIHRRRALVQAPPQRADAVPDDLEDGAGTAATIVHSTALHVTHALHATSVVVERPHQD